VSRLAPGRHRAKAMPNDGWTYREVVAPAHDGALALAYLAER
jgi:hypothetical protein